MQLHNALYSTHNQPTCNAIAQCTMQKQHPVALCIVQPQPNNCTMQKQQPGAMCTLHNNAWYTCTWLHCAKCTVCIVHCPITINCGVKTLTIWSASQRLFSTFPSPPPLKRQTRCTLVQQAILFAPHSFSLAYLYRGLQEIGEGSIFSHLKLYFWWTPSCEAQRD